MRNTRSISFVVCTLLVFMSSSAQGQDGKGNKLDIEEIPNLARINERLYRGGQPRKDGMRKLASLGVNTVINLRNDDQNAFAAAEDAKAAGLRYFNVPFDRFGRPSDAQVDQVLSLIDAKENGVVFVHCRRGQDRTGTIIALYRITRYGWTDEEAIREAKQFGMKFWQVRMKDYISDYYRDKAQGISQSGTATP